MKKRGVYCALLLVVFVLSACEASKKAESWTGEITTGAQLSGMLILVDEEQNAWSWETEKWVLSGEKTSWWTETPPQAWFPVELCNKIVAFNLCIISKAPIENQPVMKAQLQKSLEPRKLLVDADLRQICQNIVEQASFQEVLSHYTGTGHACTF